jgi:hypothetical protein
MYGVGRHDVSLAFAITAARLYPTVEYVFRGVLPSPGPVVLVWPSACPPRKREKRRRQCQRELTTGLADRTRGEQGRPPYIFGDETVAAPDPQRLENKVCSSLRYS